MTENPKFSTLIELFASLNVTEKGIERVYEYLLKKHIVHDIKELVTDLGLSLKRIYKICNVLRTDLGLIQTYDRPMKIKLLPPKEALENLIERRIEEITRTANQSIDDCKTNFSRVIEAYDLEEDTEEAPKVNYISYKTLEKEELNNAFLWNSVLNQKESLIAKGVNYECQILDDLEELLKNKEKRKEMTKLFQSVTSPLDGEKKIEVLISEDFLKNAMNYYGRFSRIHDWLNSLDLSAFDLQINVCSQDTSNFIIKDRTELYQPSFSPNNKLLGYYYTDQKEIVTVFLSKFEEFYLDSVILQDYTSAEPYFEENKITQSYLLLFSLV